MQDKITINPFDPDSIDEAIKKLEKRKERIHKCAEKLIQRLTDLGVEKAQELVPVDTGTARSSIIGYLDEAEGVGIISAGGYCKYIEFGTGVKGRDNSHPSEEYKAIMNWAYNLKGGQVYKATPPSFPYMYFKQIGGDGALSTLSNTEDGINLGLEVKFYSNKSASEVRKLANSAREYMVGIGFHCDYFSPVENVSDTSISQFLTRFSKLET